MTIGTLIAGAVPASLVTFGTFGTGSYTFDTDLTVDGNLVASGTIHSFAGTVGIGDTTPNGTLHVKAASGGCTIRVEDAGEGSDEKTWRYGVFGATLQFQAQADNYLSGNIWMQVNRSGIVVDLIKLSASAIDLDGRCGFGSSGTSTSTIGMFQASSTSVSSMRILPGTAPSSPVEGDMWSTTSGLFYEDNSGTVGPLTGTGAAAAGTLTGTTLAANVVTTSITSVGILTQVIISQASGATHAISATHSHASTPLGILVDFSASAPDDATQYFLRMDDSAGIQAVIYSDGSYEGSANSYGALSDKRLKNKILKASGVWDNYKQLNWVDFEMKDKPGKQRTGLIAQEVEVLFPHNVYLSTDVHGKRPDMFAINYMGMATETGKALVEAMTRIENLETQIAALI